MDGTLLAEIEAAGYRADLTTSVPLAARSSWLRRAGRPAPARSGAGSGSAWTAPAARSARPPGVRLDSGGICKGLAADLLARVLGAHATFAVEAAGDVRVGGAKGMTAARSRWRAHSTARSSTSSPCRRRRGHQRHRPPQLAAAATGRPAHHLLDPATGEPAYTGVVQATAVAPTALEAEARAKAAVLGGPEAAPGWLPDGGVLVLEDAGHVVVEPARRA